MNGQCFLFCPHASSLFSSTRQFEYYNAVTLEVLECGKSAFPLSQGWLLLLAVGCIFLFSNFFFSWSIVASQCCIGFFCTERWISCRYLYAPSFLDFFFFTFLFIYFGSAGSHCCTWAASGCGKWASPHGSPSRWGAQALGCSGFSGGGTCAQ